MPADEADTTPDVRELRLAVVLYGGVSLAIYMHGTTKELNRLAKASAHVEQQSDAVRTPTEDVYSKLLTELAARDPAKVRTRVIIDIIAGTSAGGINGVYLAKALAHNRPQDALRDLWLNRGDIQQLLRGPRRLPMALKAPMLLAQLVKRPPLRGEAITQWMYGALREMDTEARDSRDVDSLMPDRHVLELFVTTTDFAGYRRDLVITDPPRVFDQTHRHVFRFSYGDGNDDFTPAGNAGLTLAARSTMSFPGAFPPVDLTSFKQSLATEHADFSQLGEHLFRIYELSGADPAKAYFVDGGVLDNQPFDHAIRAIKRRAADLEVDRRLLYLEPDPGKPGARQHASDDAPNPLTTVLGAISGIPRKQPVTDNILAVSRHNDRVRRIRDIIEMTFAPIAARVEQLIGAELGQLVTAPAAADVNAWRLRINAAAEQAAGFGYATYIRSKVSGVIDRYAATICRVCDYPDDCNQGAFVRSVLRKWARHRLFTEQDGRPVPVDDQTEFLRTFDLDYGARRLRFVIDALSWWYPNAEKPGYPTRAQLDNGKRRLYELRDILLGAADGRGLPANLTDEVLEVFGTQPIDDWVYTRGLGPEQFVQERADPLAGIEVSYGRALNTALDGFGHRVFEVAQTLTDGWPEQCRADLLVRYLGFPFWDTLLYSIESVSDAGERDAIEIVRMSPLDATVLPPVDRSAPKLAGVHLMHFGAFFDRAGRENDYLWGRLDGAARLIDLLLGSTHTVAERTDWCRRAFAAIVHEEQAFLPRAKPLLEHAQRFATG